MVWLLPLPGRAAGALALLAALVEVALWIDRPCGLRLRPRAAARRTGTSWFSDLGVSYHVGFFGFSLWLAGLTIVVCAAAIGYALVGRTASAAARLPRAPALPDRLDRRRLHRPGPAALLRLLRGDADPDLRADRRLGRAAPPARDGDLRHLHDGRLAADARRRSSSSASRRARSRSSTRARPRTSGSSSASSLAFAVKAPLFPFHGWLVDAYRESPPEVAAILSGVVSKAAVFGFLRIAIAKFPEPVDDFQVAILALAAIGLVYGSLLAFRAPDIRSVTAYSSMAQMGLIVLGLFSLNDLGLDGAIAAVGRARPGLGDALPARGDGRAADAARARSPRLGGMARGRPALATVLMTTGIIALAVPGSVAFAGEFLILAGVFARAGAGRSSAPARSCSRRCTCCG